MGKSVTLMAKILLITLAFLDGRPDYKLNNRELSGNIPHHDRPLILPPDHRQTWNSPLTGSKN
jgi:hypothetical protein